MAATTLTFRKSVLPWAIAHDDEERFRRILLIVMGLSLVWGIALRFITLSEADREAPQALPPPIATLLLDKPAPPPPPPPVHTRIEPPKPDPAEPARGARRCRRSRAPRERPVVEARHADSQQAPGRGDRAAARNRAAGVGLLAALKDHAPELHGAPTAVQLNQNIKQGPGVGAGVGVGVGAGKEAGLPDRNMITSNATGGSGGIKAAAYSRDTGGTAASRAVRDDAGGRRRRRRRWRRGRPGAVTDQRHRWPTAFGRRLRQGRWYVAQRRQRQGIALARGSATRPRTQQGGDLRDLQPGVARRSDPAGQGGARTGRSSPNRGSITDAHFKSSELKAPELEAKLLTRFKLMQFQGRRS